MRISYILASIAIFSFTHQAKAEWQTISEQNAVIMTTVALSGELLKIRCYAGQTEVYVEAGYFWSNTPEPIMRLGTSPSLTPTPYNSGKKIILGTEELALEVAMSDLASLSANSMTEGRKAMIFPLTPPGAEFGPILAACPNILID